MLNTAFKEVGLDIFIKPEETSKNPGLKNMAKGMLIIYGVKLRRGLY